jgi:hypothetical protein
MSNIDWQEIVTPKPLSPDDPWHNAWRLWNGAHPYTLVVFEHRGEWDVEIYADHPIPGDAENHEFYLDTVTLTRGTHIVGDMIPHVEKALEQRILAENGGLARRSLT